MNQRIRLACLLSLPMVLTSCWWDDSPTAPERAPRNTFADYQHISGYVSGIWIKTNNPYIITGPVRIEDGDTLMIKEGVQIILGDRIEVNQNGSLIVSGILDEPAWFTPGVNLNAYHGVVRIRYAVFEGGASLMMLPYNTVIEHSTFAETGISFANYSAEAYDSLVLRNNVIAGGRPWTMCCQYFGQLQTLDPAVLDSAKTKVHHNLFYTAVGDTSVKDVIKVVGEYPVVKVSIEGGSGLQQFSAGSWPGNDNIFGDPKWVKYSYIGKSPASISQNDYHLQPGSAAIGAASDGTNIGAY